MWTVLNLILGVIVLAAALGFYTGLLTSLAKWWEEK